MKTELPASPCTRCCCFDDQKGFCVGCFRTLDEIMSWSKAGAEERRRIIELCEQRKLSQRLPDESA